MPHLALIRDPRPTRRTAFRAAVLRRFATEPELVVSERTVGDAWLGWAAGEHVAVSWHDPPDAGGTEARGRATEPGLGGTLLLGRAFDGRPEGLGAVEIAGRLDDEDMPGTADGFFLAVRVASGRVAAMADPLGLFPVYHAHAEGEGVVAVSTSPHLITCHPCFPLAVDVRGLVGLLLTQHPVADRHVVAGVERLGAGDVLEWSTSTGARTRPGYRLPGCRLADLDADEHVARLERALAGALESELSSGPGPAILLSGGRDSRLLAGLATEVADGGRALVMGRDGDYEVDVARRVADRLGLPIAAYDPTSEGYLEAARRSARWEPLVGGWSNVHTWDLGRALRGFPPVCVNGYNMDVLAGGTWFERADESPGAIPLTAVVRSVTQWGVGPRRLRRLLRPEHEGLVAEVMDDLERALIEASGDPAERAWRFVMAHGERYRVGSNVWRTSFGSWPVMPTLHAALLDAVAMADQAALADRRAQDRILSRRFPALARIPIVVANADLHAPLDSFWWDRLAFALRRRFGAPSDERQRRRERRVNWRAYDFNHPGWRAIRRSVEPYRDTLADLFLMDEVNRYLPPPDATPASNTFCGLAGLQVLVGSLMWAREHR